LPWQEGDVHVSVTIAWVVPAGIESAAFVRLNSRVDGVTPPVVTLNHGEAGFTDTV